MKKETQEFLEVHQSETPSTWREEAEWRRDNWSWLRHSQKIAVKVLLQMKQEGLTQKALAERMDCTQQYVSKILKGKENMSLDTLSKLEDALGINLIADCQPRSGRRLKKHEPQLQADGTRFDLFYSADGSDEATVYTFLYFYGAKIHFSNDICKS